MNRHEHTHGHQRPRRLAMLGTALLMGSTMLVGPSTSTSAEPVGAATTTAQRKDSPQRKISPGRRLCGARAYRPAISSGGWALFNENYKRIGGLWLMKHRNNDTFCAVVTRRYHKQELFMNAKIKRTGHKGWEDRDPTRGQYYAGPVYVERNGRDITFRGRIRGSAATCRWSPGWSMTCQTVRG